MIKSGSLSKGVVNEETKMGAKTKAILQIKKSHSTRSARNILLTGLALVLLGSGLYLLWLTQGPAYMPIPKEWNAPVPQEAKTITENRLYIPKLKLNVPYRDTEAALNDGAWHRYPERGDPEHGGNFILAGHRFEMGWTYQEINKKSPLYHIDELKTGDVIYVDFNGKRYMYEIKERIKVQPTQIEVEAPSEESKLTLYTCTLGGEADGREVVIAHVKETDVDPTKPLSE